MADEALDTGAAGEAGAAGAASTETAPPASTETAPPVVDEWADPEPLDEGLNQFDRSYVEQLRDREAKYRIKARDLSQDVEKLGVPLTEAQAAVELTKRLQTDDGVIQMFIETGQALGLGFAQLEAMFKESDEATATAAAETGPADDDVLTWAEARALLQKEVLEPQQRAAEQAALASARSTIDATFTDLGVTDETDRQAILALGQSHIQDGDFDPEHVRAAVRKGYELLEVRKTAAKEAYLAEKLAAGEGVPTNTGAAGAPGGQEPPPAPKDMDEAKARARAQLRALAAQ